MVEKITKDPPINAIRPGPIAKSSKPIKALIKAVTISEVICIRKM